jgi:hypothetical protein
MAPAQGSPFLRPSRVIRPCCSRSMPPSVVTHKDPSRASRRSVTPLAVNPFATV